MDTTLYTWIHLSDIHFGHGAPAWREDQVDVINLLIEDIPTTLKMAGQPTAEAILLTGDIAFAGTSAQFGRAIQMVHRISERLGTKPKVYAVAGNHDLARSPASDLSTFRMLTDLRAGENLDRSINHPADNAALLARFDAYRDFCDAVGAPSEVLAEWVDTIDLGTATLRLVGWNTGLLCNDSNERGLLSVSLAGAIRSLSSRHSEEIVVVLTHHGLDWLQEKLRNEVRSRMWTKHANVHLSGHEHNPDLLHATNSRGESMINITAGAVHSDQDRGWAQTEFYYSIASIVQTPSAVDLRVWPRRFSLKSHTWGPDVDSLPDDAQFIRFSLIDRGKAKPPSASSSAAPKVAAPIIDRLRRLGRRRTTFPTDISTAQVVAMNLVVPARNQYNETVLNVVDSSGTASTLILGDPGAGKTILAYTLATHWLDNDMLPIIIDLRELDGADTKTSIRQMLETELGVDDADRLRRVRFIVDGLDEALSSGLEPETIARRIAALEHVAPIVALCRRREYVTRLSTWLSETFDVVIDLAEWRRDDFIEYLSRLAEAGQIADVGLGDLVSKDPRLGALTTRPLLARMLTLVATATDDLPTDVPALYNAYLTRLAESADVGLRRVTGSQGSVAMDVWRRVAWEMFQGHDRGVDAFTPEQVLAAATSDGVSSDAAFRAIEAIMDVDASGNTVSFLHYSLFEFLVAHTITDRLTEHAATNPAAAAAALSKDLTHEIRSYVVSLLRGASTLNLNRWPGYFTEIYRAGRNLNAPTNLTVCNLVGYFLSRLGISGENALLALLKVEDDLFLRNSIMWALAREDHRPTASDYLRDLVANRRAAAINRGYLLYYYGDVSEHDGPPYVDTRGPWRNTRQKVTDKLSGPGYATSSASRRLIDVFTFCDMAHARDERITEQEAHLIDTVLTTIPYEASTEHSIEIVRQRLDEVRP